jgi:hypothetical protein
MPASAFIRSSAFIIGVTSTSASASLPFGLECVAVAGLLRTRGG